MIHAYSGFAIVSFAILVGYLAGKSGVLGESARTVLSKTAFYVLSPLLLFTILASANIEQLLANYLPVFAIASSLVFILFFLYSFLRKKQLGETIIGALGSGYVNANNIGIPIATYVLGSASYSAPLVLLQLMLWAPLALIGLEAWSLKTINILKILKKTYSNPFIVGSLLGLFVSIFGIRLPQVLLDATGLIGYSAIPVLLLSFGISLHGNKILSAPETRSFVYVASSLKLIVMPILAWVLASFVFRLGPQDIFTATVLAALPAAQYVFNYASEYQTGLFLARDVVFITTFGSIPVLLLITWLLG